MLDLSTGLTLKHLEKSEGQTEVNVGYHGCPTKWFIPWDDLGVTISAAINLNLCEAFKKVMCSFRVYKGQKGLWPGTHTPDNITSQTAP